MNKLIFLYLVFIFIKPCLCNTYWKSIDKFLLNKSFNDFPSVSMVDIDNDRDLDIFIGSWDGYLSFYRNISKDKKFKFRLENSGVSLKTSFQKISAGIASVPFWVDIDNDMDYDLFLGNLDGTITYYKNNGTLTEPDLQLINKGDNKKNSYFQIDVGYNSVPFFVDIDSDGDYDLFIGERDGYINFFENKGNKKNAFFRSVNFAENIKSSFNNIDVGECSYPAFYDIDNDNDYDLFVGNWEGLLFFYRNDGTGFELFFNEINYAISRKFSFNNYQSDADSRIMIADFYRDKHIEFIFSRINGTIEVFQTTDEFINLVKKDKKIDNNIRMANYYFEIGKEEYLNGNLIQAKIFLNKGKKHNKLTNIAKLINLLDNEIQKLINEQTVQFNKSFARTIFTDAVKNLLNGNYRKSITLLNQLKDVYKGNKELVNKYLQMAREFEKARKKILIVEELDDKALSYYDRKKYKKALKTWNQALSLMPENYDIVENIIECENKIEEIETDKIIKKLLKKARIYMKRNQKRKSINMYARIIELGDSHLSKAVKKEVYQLRNDIMKFKSEENLKKLDGLYKKGNIYMDEEKYEKAMENFKKIIFYNSSYKDVKEKLKSAKEELFKHEKMK